MGVEIGDTVFIVSQEATNYVYSESYIKNTMMGVPVKVECLTRNQFGKNNLAQVRRCIDRSHPDHFVVSVDVQDLDHTNSYVDRRDELPQFMLDVNKMTLSMASTYRCYFLMYKNTREAWNFLDYNERYEYLLSENEDCDSEVVVGVNNNISCWANVFDIWEEMERRHDKNPTRLLARIDRGNLCDCWSDYEDLIFFYEQMQKGYCLPSSLKLPTTKDNQKDLYFNIRLNKITPERLFWYLCVIRNPAEQPGLVKVTNHFIRQGRMEPLMAYILAHVCMPKWEGGHAVIERPIDYRDQSQCGVFGEIQLPDIKKVVTHVIKCHKFLTTKGGKYITETEGRKGQYWDLNNTTKETFIRVTPNKRNLKESIRFSVKTQTFRK